MYKVIGYYVFQFIAILLIIFFLTGCVSSGILTVLSGADVVSQLTTGKGTVDNVVSKVSGKDCAVWRMFKGKKVCKDAELEEMVDYMMELDCDTYIFTKNDIVYCKEE